MRIHPRASPWERETETRAGLFEIEDIAPYGDATARLNGGEPPDRGLVVVQSADGREDVLGGPEPWPGGATAREGL